MNNQLTQVVSKHLLYRQDEVLQAFVEQIKKTLNNSVSGIVFYGSCMRTREYKGAMLDFYVIVDRYSHAYGSYWYRVANSLLPPNVFYIQIQHNGQQYRAKYAVMTQQSLIKHVTHSFHSYFWARFCQPVACIYSHKQGFDNWLVDIQARAAQSFAKSVMPGLANSISSDDFWKQGLQLTYAAELRTEKKQRAELIYQSQREFYDDVFECLLKEKKFYKVNILVNDLKWRLRILFGKVLSILRLIKATTTFVGGVDYIAWKIERHTGERLIITDKMRKYPLLYCWPTLFRLFKQGKIQ